MADEKGNEEKWAVNIAFTGSEATVRKIVKLVESLEEEGNVDDFTWIDGPYESLQLMLKRRAENLALDVGLAKTLPSIDAKLLDNDKGEK